MRTASAAAARGWTSISGWSRGKHDVVAPSGSAGRTRLREPNSGKQKTPDYRGFLRERLKGLEPSTFCMAIGMTSARIWLIYLQIRWFCVLVTPNERLRMRGVWAQSARVSGTNPERSDRVASGADGSISGGRGETDPGCLSSSVDADSIGGHAVQVRHSPAVGGPSSNPGSGTSRKPC
jgi:hypothetical protein